MPEQTLFILVVLSSLALLQSVAALVPGLRFLSMFKRSRRREAPEAGLSVALIVPCRGVDPGLEANLRSLFRLDYASKQLVFVTGDRNDPAVPVIERVRSEFPEERSRLLHAGFDPSRGQKVHALLEGVKALGSEPDVLAFADSDGRPDPDWLQNLVVDLDTPGVGICTGFRWYVPERGNFASVLRAVWNSVPASLLASSDAPFAWGGAMAIRREVFESCRVAERWQNALSDDYAISRAVKDRGLRIVFVPRCLTLSFEDTTLRELIGWTCRQLLITRVYHPRLWFPGILSELFANLVFWAVLITLVSMLFQGEMGEPLVVALLLSWVLTLAAKGLKGWLRIHAVDLLFDLEGRGFSRHVTAHCLMPPVTGLLSLYAFLHSAVTRELEWRGIRYRLRSPHRTEVVAGGPER